MVCGFPLVEFSGHLSPISGDAGGCGYGESLFFRLPHPGGTRFACRITRAQLISWGGWVGSCTFTRITYSIRLTCGSAHLNARVCLEHGSIITYRPGNVCMWPKKPNYAW